MTGENEQMVLSLGYQMMKENPRGFPQTVEAATEGVSAFASSQQDRATEFSVRLFTVLDNPHTKPPTKGKYLNFTTADVISRLEGCFDAKGLAPLREKFGVSDAEMDVARKDAVERAKLSGNQSQKWVD
jgi:hypothetical protein